MLLRVLHPRFIQLFEDDARTQVKLHITMTWAWLFMMVVAAVYFWPRSTNDLIQLIILEVSLYANVITHYGALSAAQASLKADRANRQNMTLAVD